MQALLHSLVQKPSAGEMHACISEVLALPSAENFLYEWLYPLGFNSSQIADIHQSMRVNQPGKRFRSKEWEVLRDRHLLLVRRADAVIALPEIEATLVEVTPSFQIPTAKDVVCVDADKVQPPFEVRKWESGDTFVPFGMKGKKNVCKYMTDRKFSLFQKEYQYVALSGDQIVWLIGERLDNRFCISETTQRAWVLRIKQ